MPHFIDVDVNRDHTLRNSTVLAFSDNAWFARHHPEKTVSFGQAALDIKLAVTELRRYADMKEIFDSNYCAIHDAGTETIGHQLALDTAFPRAEKNKMMFNLLVTQQALHATYADETKGDVAEFILKDRDLHFTDFYIREPSAVRYIHNEVAIIHSGIENGLSVFPPRTLAQQAGQVLFHTVNLLEDAKAFVTGTPRAAVDPSDAETTRAQQNAAKFFEEFDPFDIVRARNDQRKQALTGQGPLQRVIV